MAHDISLYIDFIYIHVIMIDVQWWTINLIITKASSSELSWSSRLPILSLLILYQ